MAKTPKLNFRFIKDEPRSSERDGYKGFYHASVAPALRKILKDSSSPHTIGLFGAWGTGKSTILEMVQYDKELNMPVFLFDAWKYQEDTLRRTFLIKLVEYLGHEGYDLPDDILVSLYSSRAQSVAKKKKIKTKISTRSKLWSFTKKYMPFISAVFLLIGACVLVTLYPNNVASQLILQIVSIASGITFLAVFGKPILEGVLKIVVESFFAKQEQQTELITEIHQEERLNSPEQFEQKFIEILSRVDKRLIIVFDNIDRVQGDVAISMLSTIKTFMYSGSENKIVFVVPCDPKAIEVQVKKYFHGDNFEQLPIAQDSFEASEYLRKIFNLILWVPEFINSDLEEYTRALLKQTGDDVSTLLDDEDVVIVINAAFSRNPREIIQFINNLVALIITVEGTKVRDIIYRNIAYLAKILVLRQKFPDAYERLKIAWYTPENIYTAAALEGTQSELQIFMQSTNRITVDNAEPFIYFKDASDTRGLKNPTELATALAAANNDDAVELTKSEDHDRLLLFIADQVKRYASQEKVLLNVVLTQFSLVSTHGISTNNKKYINDLMHFIDTSLWSKYAELPVTDMFNALSNGQLDKSLKVKIVDRYIAALDTDEVVSPIKRQIVDAFRKNLTLLKNAQKAKLRSVIERRFGGDEETLALFSTLTDQEELISEELTRAYINGLDYDNISTRLHTLSSYKEFLVKHNQLSSIIDTVYSLLNRDMTATTAYTENKAAIVDAVGILIDKFKPDIKNSPENLSNLVAELVNVFTAAPQWEQKASIVNALFWLEGSVSDSDNATIISTIQSYFQSWGSLQHIQEPINNWNDSTAQSLIKIALPALLNRLISEQDVLQFVYDKAANEEKSTIINHIISHSPLDNLYDINFIGQLPELPDRKIILTELLDKAGRTSWNYKQPYYSYVADKIESKDADLKATAIDQAKQLIMSGDSQQGEVGLNFLNSLDLTASERRVVPSEVLTWLRDPGRSISSEHRIAFRTVTESYSLLQETAKNDFVFLLFNLLEQSRDPHSVQVIVDSLVTIRPKYKDNGKDFDDLLTRLQTWPDTQTKQYIYQEIPKLNAGGRSKVEKLYWQSFTSLYPEKES